MKPSQEVREKAVREMKEEVARATGGHISSEKTDRYIAERAREHDKRVDAGATTKKKKGR